MAKPLLQFSRIDQTLSDFGERLDVVRQDLYFCDITTLKGRLRELSQNIRASAYVHVAAALERLVADILNATLEEISVATIELRSLKLSLFALIQAPQLDSLQELRGLKMWLRRSELFKATWDQSPCALAGSSLPIDGKTIRPEHLETIWAIFEFPTLPLPNPLWRLALSELADSRNIVAHGEDGFRQVAGRRSIADMLRMIEQVESIAIHIWTTITSYLENEEYLRA